MRISDWSSDVCSSDLAWAWLWPRAPLLVYPAPEAHGPPLPEGSGDNAQARMHPAGDDVHHLRAYRDRKSVVEGKSVSERVDLGGRRIIKKKKTQIPQDQSNINRKTIERQTKPL